MGTNLTAERTFKFIGDRFAEAIISDSQILSQRNIPVDKISNSPIALRQNDTRELLKVLSKFDDQERKALVARLIEPDKSKALAYVPREVAEKFAIKA